MPVNETKRFVRNPRKRQRFDPFADVGRLDRLPFDLGPSGREPVQTVAPDPSFGSSGPSDTETIANFIQNIGRTPEGFNPEDFDFLGAPSALGGGIFKSAGRAIQGLTNMIKALKAGRSVPGADRVIKSAEAVRASATGKEANQIGNLINQAKNLAKKGAKKTAETVDDALPTKAGNAQTLAQEAATGAKAPRGKLRTAGNLLLGGFLATEAAQLTGLDKPIARGIKAVLPGAFTAPTAEVLEKGVAARTVSAAEIEKRSANRGNASIIAANRIAARAARSPSPEVMQSRFEQFRTEELLRVREESNATLVQSLMSGGASSAEAVQAISKPATNTMQMIAPETPEEIEAQRIRQAFFDQVSGGR